MTPRIRLVRDFAIAYAGALVGVVLLVEVLERALGLTTSSVTSVVPMMAAAFFAGARHAERERAAPDGATAWAAAFPCALVAFGISFLALAVAVLIVGEVVAVEVQGLLADPATLLVIVAILFAVHVLVVRFLVPMGARMQLRGMEKRRGR